MYRNVLIVLAVVNILTGLQIFFMPQFFYDNVPGVSMMGPFNLHFIRDAGLSFLAAGLMQGFGVRKSNYLVCVVATTWPVFHALFHIQMWMARGFSLDLIAFVNLIGIQLPAWAALYAAMALYNSHKGTAHD